MKKRFLALTLTMLLFLSCLPVGAAAETTLNDADAVQKAADNVAAYLLAQTNPPLLPLISLGKLETLPAFEDLGLTLPITQNEDGSYGTLEQHIDYMLAWKAYPDSASLPTLMAYGDWRAAGWLFEQQRDNDSFPASGSSEYATTAKALLAAMPPEGGMTGNMGLGMMEKRTLEYLFTNKPETSIDAAYAVSALIHVPYSYDQQIWGDNLTELTRLLLTFQLPDGSFSSKVGGKTDPDATSVAAIALGDLLAGDSVYVRLPTLYLEAEKAAAQEALEGLKDKPLPYFDYESIQEWALPYITYCYDNALMIGDEKGYFNPKKHVTRAELAKMLSSFLPQDEKLTAQLYPDVTEVMWHYTYVQLCGAQGLILPRSDGAFYPRATASREEVAYAIAKLLQLETDDPVQSLVKAGIWQGDGKGNMRPTDAITRDEMAKTLTIISE